MDAPRRMLEKPVWEEGRVWRDASGLVCTATVGSYTKRDGEEVRNARGWRVDWNAPRNEEDDSDG